MLSINTNLPSLIAQTSFKTSTNKLNTAIERMTTGFKINSAKDNAANYSITTNMSTKISAYQVAEDNCAMGLDLLTTASESLDLINDKLVRLRALAEQAANGTYGNQSLKAINAEANALVDEIERQYKTTEYNGRNLFGTSCGNFISEVEKRDTSNMTTLESVDKNSTISSGTYSISTAKELAKLATMTNSGKVTGGEFVLANNIDLGETDNWRAVIGENKPFTADFDGNGFVISNMNINANKPLCGLFGYTENCTIKNLGMENVKINPIYTNTTVIAPLICQAYSTEILNCYSTGTIKNNSSNAGAGGLVGTASQSKITDCYSNCDVTSTNGAGALAYVADSRCIITNCYATGRVKGKGVAGLCLSGRELNIINCYSTSILEGETIFGLGSADRGNITNSYYVGKADTPLGAADMNIDDLSKVVSSEEQIPLNQINTCLQIGINGNENSQINLNTALSIRSVSSLRNIGLSSNDYLTKIDEIINTISTKQTTYGAAQNRLESALEEISTQYENLVSSRSTLKDADIAEVSSEYIRQQILQQASATLLATANQSPALALQLI